MGLVEQGDPVVRAGAEDVADVADVAAYRRADEIRSRLSCYLHGWRGIFAKWDVGFLEPNAYCRRCTIAATNQLDYPWFPFAFSGNERPPWKCEAMLESWATNGWEGADYNRQIIKIMSPDWHSGAQSCTICNG